MIFSPANPVKFWLTGIPTFNETVVDGINYACWKQPWNCSDEIPNQFTDDPGQTFNLVIVDAAGNTLYEEEIPEVASGVYQISFVPEDISICNAEIQLRITDGASPETILARSDAQKIKTAHAETELITFSHNRNYHGLKYLDISPAPTFYLRVPCVFFHERFPQEDKAMERTSSTIVTASKLKKQRLMQVIHAPDYFHEKLILALSHSNVTIDSKTWSKEEAYEKDEGDLRYPLKKATVLLTEKNFLARKVL